MEYEFVLDFLLSNLTLTTNNIIIQTTEFYNILPLQICSLNIYMIWTVICINSTKLYMEYTLISHFSFLQISWIIFNMSKIIADYYFRGLCRTFSSLLQILIWRFASHHKSYSAKRRGQKTASGIFLDLLLIKPS